MLYKTNSKNNFVNENMKIPLKFDISMLNMLIGYLFIKNNSQITRKSLNNLKKLIDITDDASYIGNDAMYERFDFIRKALDARLNKGFENMEMIINYCQSDVDNKINKEIIDNIPLYVKINSDEIEYINRAIEDRLKFYYVYLYKDQIYSTVEKVDSGDFRSLYEINSEMIDVCTKFVNQARKAKSIDDMDTFSLADENFENNIIDIAEKLKNPSSMLYTGIQKLNQMFAPALMAGRLYMFMGLPGGFKSGILLKIARDIKMYNKGLVGKKSGKRPCVLLITMENTVQESVERLFNMTVTAANIRDYSPKEVIKLIKENGELTINDDENMDIDIIIKYFPNRAIDTSDLYTIIDDLSDEGKEVIAFILDYIKRIRPYERAKDEKEELKNVTNELKSLAQHFDIPVVSAAQLNRSGASTVDSAMQSNKEDLARFLGRSNVGSAWEIIENSDWCCIINIEKKKETGQYYLTFKRVKIRYGDKTNFDYFNHPFNMENRMQLIDDIYLDEPLSEESLSSNFEGIELLNKKSKKTLVEREVDTSDIFNFGKSLT